MVKHFLPNWFHLPLSQSKDDQLITRLASRLLSQVLNMKELQIIYQITICNKQNNTMCLKLFWKRDILWKMLRSPILQNSWYYTYTFIRYLNMILFVANNEEIPYEFSSKDRRSYIDNWLMKRLADTVTETFYTITVKVMLVKIW